MDTDMQVDDADHDRDRQYSDIIDRLVEFDIIKNPTAHITPTNPPSVLCSWKLPDIFIDTRQRRLACESIMAILFDMRDMYIKMLPPTKTVSDCKPRKFVAAGLTAKDMPLGPKQKTLQRRSQIQMEDMSFPILHGAQAIVSGSFSLQCFFILASMVTIPDLVPSRILPVNSPDICHRLYHGMNWKAMKEEMIRITLRGGHAELVARVLANIGASVQPASIPEVAPVSIPTKIFQSKKIPSQPRRTIPMIERIVKKVSLK